MPLQSCVEENQRKMLFSSFQKYISTHRLFAPEDLILVAVSGGVDSMTLLALLVQGGYRVGVAHCNFQLRGEESDLDEALVVQTAQRLGVPIYVQRFDTLPQMERTEESVQMAARRLRYSWFEELCDEFGYTRIAVAQHGNDAAETFFINLIRGTGLRGLTGIAPIRQRVIRPLGFASRQQIADYAQATHLPYREDASNSSTRYLRNQVRLELIPAFEKIAPSFGSTMQANLDHLSGAQLFIDQVMEMIRSQAVSEWQGGYSIDLQKIASELPREFVLFELMSPWGFSGEVVQQIDEALRQPHAVGKRFYGVHKVAYLDRARILVDSMGAHQHGSWWITPTTQKLTLPTGTLELERLGPDEVDTLKQPQGVAMVDEAKIVYPLELRSWREGDTFVPFGMMGHQKVSDWLINAKMPRPLKEQQLVLLSSDEVVWLVGCRADAHFCVAPSTRSVLKITFTSTSVNEPDRKNCAAEDKVL